MKHTSVPFSNSINRIFLCANCKMGKKPGKDAKSQGIEDTNETQQRFHIRIPRDTNARTTNGNKHKL